MRLAGRAVLVACALASLDAAAFTTGVSGFSGQQGKVCDDCHGGSSVAPSAKLSGPTTLAAGQSATYQLVVDTDVNSGASVKRAAGIDIATSAGALATVVQPNATRLLNGEISHTDALPKAKTVAISFQLTAPAQRGTLTLFAAALSADGNGGKSGDATAATVLDVTVVAPTPPDLVPPIEDLTPVDLAGADFSGLDLAPPLDLTAPPDDLTSPVEVDAMSAATSFAPTTPPDLGPARDEARWSCSTSGASEGALAGLIVLLSGVGLRRGRRRDG